MTKGFEYYKQIYGNFVLDKDIYEALRLFDLDDSVVRYLNYLRELREV